MHEVKTKKKLHGLANFKVFRWNISLSANLLFLKSANIIIPTALASNAIMKEGPRIMPETDSFEMVHFLWGRDFRRRRTKGCVSAIFCRVELGLAALYYHSTTTRQQQLEKAADGPTFYFSFFWPKKTSKK